MTHIISPIHARNSTKQSELEVKCKLDQKREKDKKRVPFCLSLATYWLGHFARKCSLIDDQIRNFFQGIIIRN